MKKKLRQNCDVKSKVAPEEGLLWRIFNSVSRHMPE
jgi:hypothetical protein